MNEGSITAWVTGAGGLIGSAAVAAAPKSVTVVPLTRPDLDLLDDNAVKRRFDKDRPELIVHCAAMSRTADCEATPEHAWRVNAEATDRIARLNAAVRVVFLSTDLVFDGAKGAYNENDAVRPLNVYGRTKVAAEESVRRSAKGLVVRTSLNYGRSPTGDRSFNEVMEAVWRAGRPATLFSDEFRNPIAVAETARLLWKLAMRDTTGVLHIAGAERLSRVEIGRLIAARRPELNPRIIESSLRAFSGPPRAADVTLDCSAAEAILGEGMPAFAAWLATRPQED
jgi:dTDP-4-dehydrorhamnose reductase